MAGNGVILKHASICTGSGLMLRDLCRIAGLPEGLFDIVVVDHDTSDQIIAHKYVRGVTMTGSDTAGRKIGEMAAKHLKKSVLELGSNDAYIVLEDADVELAVKMCVQGRLYNNGETCVSAKRFVVTEPVYDAFVEGFVEQMKAVVMGDPTSSDTQLGPVASKEQFATLSKQVSRSVEGGATLLCGGVPEKGVGFFFPPTVLAECRPGTPAYDDEIFGPVASIIKASDGKDAMRIANDSRYGLGGAIFTNDQDKAFRLARDHFDTGMVRIPEAVGAEGVITIELRDLLLEGGGYEGGASGQGTASVSLYDSKGAVLWSVSGQVKLKSGGNFSAAPTFAEFIQGVIDEFHPEVERLKQ